MIKLIHLVNRLIKDSIKQSSRRHVLVLFILMSSCYVYAQERMITGTVLDDMGTPLPGATVAIPGTATGTVTDLEGQYSIRVSQDADRITFSFIGFNTLEVAIDQRSVIDVQLETDVQSLDEVVVVVGYGTQKSSKVTTAVSRMAGKDVAQLPVTSADQALQGRVSGVFISGSGAPGRNPTVRIRGIGSALGSDPLFVVDGIIVGQNALNEIHPDNIEDISVEDAASTAIYGSRGANGVILITTKKGTPGMSKLSISAYYGWQSLPESKKYDLLNTDQYINFAQNTYGISAPRFDDYDFASKSFRAGTPSEEFTGVETDWQDAVLPGGPIQDYYLNYQGGTEKISYSVGGGFFDQDGLLVNTYFRRASLNTNIQAKVNDRLKIGQSMILSRSVSNQDFRTPVIEAIQMMPYIPVYDASRKGGFRGPDFAENADPFQPVLHSSIVDDEQTATKLFATAFAEIKLLEPLSFRFQAGLENSLTQKRDFVPSFDAGQVLFNVNESARFGRTDEIYLSPILTGTFNYTESFGGHTLSAIVGYERQIQDLESISSGTNLLPNESILNPGIAPIESQTSSRYVQRKGIISWFSRVNYDFEDKYLLSASIRRDQSSVFAPDYNVGYFPSASFGWRVSEESFFTPASVLFSDLKFRASWGITGNTALPAYTWDPVTFTDIRYNLADDQIVQGLTTNAIFNERLRWEETKMTNLGLDFEMLQGRIYGSLEWFKKSTDGLIVRVPVSYSTGIEVSPLSNIGDVDNQGFEIALGITDQKSIVKWNLDVNASYITNEVKKVGVDEEANVSGPVFWNTSSPATRAEAGEPLGFYYGWKVDKIYQDQAEINADNQAAADATGDASATRQGPDIAPGDIRCKDLNGDGIIDGDDRTNIGHYLPDWTLGINGSASYKNFDVSMNITGAFGFELLHANRYYTEGMTRLFNMGTEVLDAWSEDNKNTNIPRANAEAGTNNARLSDRWVEKGDYVRLRFLTVGYTLPEIPGTSTIRIYGQAQNLLTFTKYTGYDPEVQGKPSYNSNAGENGDNPIFYNGVDDGMVPNPRTFILGLEVTF